VLYISIDFDYFCVDFQGSTFGKGKQPTFGKGKQPTFGKGK
jgi:hypothetical protein